MRSMLVSFAVSAVVNVLSLGFAAWIFDGFDIRAWWLLLAAVIVTALTMTLRQLVTGSVVRFVRGYTIVGGLLLTFAVLAVTDLLVPSRGFFIDGTWTWVAVTTIVWAAGIAYGEVDKLAPADAPAVGESLI